MTDGPFAWLLWDAGQRVLVATRDRMGLHSLYYQVDGARVLVATRLESILGVLPHQPRLNPRSVTAHINAQAPLSGETFYSDIQAIEAGGQLVITDSTVRVNRYWTVAPQPTLRLSSDREYATACRELLFEVVASYVSNRRVAVTLSGGLDSTTLAAAIRTRTPEVECLAFSWSTPELPESDETVYWSSVSEYLGLPAVEIRADQHWPLSEPEGICTTPATPFYHYYTQLWRVTFEAVRQHDVQLLFDGTSGDHLFGADVLSYPDLLLGGRWMELARQLRLHLLSSEKSLVQILWLGAVQPILVEYFPRWYHTRDQSPVAWLGTAYHDLYRQHFARRNIVPTMLPGKHKRIRVLQDRLLSAILNQLDTLAGEYGLDLRHPLLDHRLVEFSLSLPTTQSFHANRRKYIVRNAMQGFLPNKVLDFQGKIWASAISRRGLREREQAQVWSLMTDMRAADLGFVDEDRLRQNYQDYLDGKHQSSRFWYALTLEDWLRRYF